MGDEVFILTAEPIEVGGGQERFLQGLAAGFHERGFHVRVFCRENSAPLAWKSLAGAGKFRRFLASALDGYFIGRAAKKAAHTGVRIVLSNSTVGWFPMGTATYKVHFYHGTYRAQAEAIRPFISTLGYLRLKWWDSMIWERLSGRGKLCLCNSDQTREEIHSFFGHEAVTVGLPLDTTHFRPMDRSACRRALGLPEDAAVGLFVGSTHPQKGFAVVRSLLEEFRHTHWVLALRDSQAPKVKSGFSVLTLLNVPYDKLPQLYNAADFCLCPSRYEPFGYVVAEALACGTPVIASPGGASCQLLARPPLDRLLIRAEDTLAYSRAIHEVLGDPQAYRELIVSRVRPALEKAMAPESWWRNFLRVTRL